MKKLSFLFIFIYLTLSNIHAQDIIFTFNAKDASNTIDSIKATKVETGETAFVEGTNTISLSSFTTGTELQPTNFEEINVYPNPFDSQTELQFYSNQSDNIKVSLINTAGQIIAEKNQIINSGLHKFTISVKSKGLYIINITGNQNKFSQKIVAVKNNQSSNKIDYNGYSSQLKKEKSAKIEGGELIHFFVYSGDNITKIADSPTESKTYEVEFYECKDGDGKNYPIVQIGEQWWMAENLAYLPAASPPTIGSNTEPYYYVYGYSGTDVAAAQATANYSTYGVLYNWPAAKSACPAGWHLPSDDEWKQLEMTLGMTQAQIDSINSRGTDQGTQMKATNGWKSNGYGTNITGFSGLPGGGRYDVDDFYLVEEYGFWWSTTEYSSIFAFVRYLQYDNTKVSRDPGTKENGFSVRCVKD